MILRIRAGVLLVILLLQGCTSLFFAPMKQQFITPDRIAVRYQDVHLLTRDQQDLHAWFLPATGPSRGRVLYLHGNGENISTHIASVYWLPSMGYEVLLLDYRGYGQSGGAPAVPDVLQDIDAAFDWLQAHSQADKPLMVYGQSLGAALAFQWLSLRQPPAVTAVVYDSVFHSYPAMVRKVLQESWLTWLFSYPVSFFFTGSNDPLRFAARQPAIPRLFIHSRDDAVVPFSAGEKLYVANQQEACLIESTGLHIGFVQQVAGRETLAAFFADPREVVRQCAQVNERVARQSPASIPLPTIHPKGFSSND